MPPLVYGAGRAALGTPSTNEADVARVPMGM